MVYPPILQKGNTVGIVAPGRKMQREEIIAAVEILNAWGIKVVLGANLFSNKHSYLSGTDAERLADFQSMVDNKEVQVIICARGGYGSTRFLDAVNFDSFKVNPKWVVGFSDVTAIHLKLFSIGYQSVHGTMPILFSNVASASSVESLRKALFGDAINISANANAFNRHGEATGKTLGGNLSLIVDSLGTGSEPDTAGKILILEEIDEYLYRLDRMMVQLKRAGKLSNLAGLIIGHFTDIKDSELGFGESYAQIISRVVSAYTYPVAFDFPIGHDNPNYAWRHGGSATLRVNNTGSSLVYL